MSINPKLKERYEYLTTKYASDFKSEMNDIDWVISQFDRCQIAAPPSILEDASFLAAFNQEGKFLGVDDLKQFLEKYGNSLADSLSEVKQLRSTDEQSSLASAKGLDLLRLLKEYDFDVAAAFAAGLDPLLTSERQGDFNKDERIQKLQNDFYLNQDTYPHHHKITDNLFISDETFVGIGTGESKDLSSWQDEQLVTLQELGITHIVCCVEREPTWPNTIQYHQVPLGDNPTEADKLVSIFETAHNFIDQAIQGGGKALVHCNCGMSRSATVLIAHLMMAEQLTYKEAYMKVKLKRVIIGPNEGFEDQLIRLEQTIKSKKK